MSAYNKFLLLSAISLSAQAATKIVLIAGTPSHNNREGGWPTDESVFQGAAALVF